MAFLDETGLAEVWGLIESKYPRIATGEYAGTGTYGQNSKNSLTFDFEPKMVIIFGVLDRVPTHSGLVPGTSNYAWGNSMIWVYGQESATISGSSNAGTLTITQSGNTLTWYCSNNITAFNQLNESGYHYHYWAIG